MSNNNHVLKVGDWVRGISNEGEFILGYIASLDDVEGVVTVIIVKRDNKYTKMKQFYFLVNTLRNSLNQKQSIRSKSFIL